MTSKNTLGRGVRGGPGEVQDPSGLPCSTFNGGYVPLAMGYHNFKKVFETDEQEVWDEGGK